jgi:hypothetical protein
LIASKLAPTELHPGHAIYDLPSLRDVENRSRRFFGHFDPLLAVAIVLPSTAAANNDSHNKTPGRHPHMLTYYSDDHHLHHGSCELIDGKLMPCFEKPQRADHILARVKDRQLGEVHAPKDFGRAPIERIHSAAYLDFFQGAWTRWQEQGGQGDLLPYTWPARTLRSIMPSSLHGQLGYYSFDAGAPITAGTWQAAYSAAQVALSAQAEIAAGAHSNRPPRAWACAPALPRLATPTR